MNEFGRTWKRRSSWVSGRYIIVDFPIVVPTNTATTSAARQSGRSSETKQTAVTAPTEANLGAASPERQCSSHANTSTASVGPESPLVVSVRRAHCPPVDRREGRKERATWARGAIAAKGRGEHRLRNGGDITHGEWRNEKE